MTDLGARLGQLRERTVAAAHRAGRSPQEVQVLAISKTFPPERVLEAVSAGQRRFGENRVQEAEQKVPAVNAASPERLEWHLVGQLQRNKARKAVALFDVIHSVDRLVLGREIDKAAAALQRRPRLLLQVNIDEEPQKGGALPTEVGELLGGVAALPHVEVVGLMAIPRACEDPEEVRPSFARLHALLEELRSGHPAGRGLRELSMGMSADYEIAIEEGATWIRVGTALFGERGKR